MFRPVSIFYRLFQGSAFLWILCFVCVLCLSLTDVVLDCINSWSLLSFLLCYTVLSVSCSLAITCLERMTSWRSFLLSFLVFLSLIPPFHQGLFGPIWTRLSPTNQSFNLPDGRPASPPIAQLSLTRLSPEFINESRRLFLPNRDSHVPIIRARLVFALKFVLPEHFKMVLH